MPSTLRRESKVPSLVAMGFVDTTAPPAGIWTAFNQIKGPKEAAPMIDSPHNHLATAQQQQPYTSRSAAWLDILVKGGEVKPGDMTSSNAGVATKFDDHQNMMDQLGIKALRRGPDPNNQSTFDEAIANPFKDSMPDGVDDEVDGTKVSTADQWRQRRARNPGRL